MFPHRVVLLHKVATLLDKVDTSTHLIEVKLKKETIYESHQSPKKCMD